jgi:hypothetical protein
VHSGWWTEDRQFMFVHDELDEQGSGLNTTLRVFSLSNLNSPQLAGTWTGPTNAIDHNGFVRGNRYYMSNYKRGLTILDISNPASPVLTAHLDTYPFADNSGFSGAWGVYPYLSNGTIAVSDINSGVYLARDRSRDVAAGSLSFQSSSYGAVEGQTAGLTVTRTGSGAGAVSVDIESVHATADASDYTLQTTTLNWADGDSSTRTVAIAADRTARQPDRGRHSWRPEFRAAVRERGGFCERTATAEQRHPGGRARLWQGDRCFAKNGQRCRRRLR